MRITLHEGAVHERPRITFIAIGHNEFSPPAGLSDQIPFSAGRITGPASTPQTAGGDHAANFSRCHVVQGVVQGGIAAGSGRSRLSLVRGATVLQHDAPAVIAVNIDLPEWCSGCRLSGQYLLHQPDGLFRAHILMVAGARVALN